MSGEEATHPDAAAPSDLHAGAFAPDAEHWQVLPKLKANKSVKREEDGSITVSRDRMGDGCILYGPHWWLRSGAYRLDFQIAHAPPRMRAQPILGLEIIAQNRFRRNWFDFMAEELPGGQGSVTFAVPLEMGSEEGQEARFEFKFYQFANCDMSVRAVTLTRLRDAVPDHDAPLRWRLLGRMRPLWMARRNASGGVTVPRLAPAGCFLNGGWPYLRLAAGAYRLTLRGRTSAPKDSAPMLSVEILGRSYWRDWQRQREGLKALYVRQTEFGIPIAAKQFAADQLDAASIDFTVPFELSLDEGEDAPFEIKLNRLALVPLAIEDMVLEWLGPAPAAVLTPESASRLPARTRIVVVGNCQADVICEGFRLSEELNRHFAVKYHFANLQPNLHEAARRDLDSCDIVLAQNIADWDNYPLRDAIPTRAQLLRFPLLAFTSLWPFDHYNGPGDKEPIDREWPNLTFTYLDGLLGRLRREIPDKEARFRAYESLEGPGVINYVRLHEFEQRRLLAMDAQFGGAIGQFILDNFRQRQLFFTTNHPSGDVFAMLMQRILNLLEVKLPFKPVRRLDILGDIQVPVHPKVAAALGVRWADRNTLYQVRGEAMTWETYVRRYIDHYG